MKLLPRFRQWIAEPILHRLAVEHAREVLAARQAAFELGFQQGQAVGQLQGQQHLLTQFVSYMDERRAEAYEVTPADIERAKKGMVH